MSNADCNNACEQIKVASVLMVKQPLHVTLVNQNWLLVECQNGRGEIFFSNLHSVLITWALRQKMECSGHIEKVECWSTNTVTSTESPSWLFSTRNILKPARSNQPMHKTNMIFGGLYNTDQFTTDHKILANQTKVDGCLQILLF